MKTLLESKMNTPTTGQFLDFINSNIRVLRPLVNKVVMNRDYLQLIREAQKQVGDNILKKSEWFCEDENKRILSDKDAWQLSESDFEGYCKIRYEGFKENEVIRKLIPSIDTIGFNTCIEWIFNGEYIKFSKELLEMFDTNLGTRMQDEYDMDKRRELVNSVCSAVKAYCKP